MSEFWSEKSSLRARRLTALGLGFLALAGTVGDKDQGNQFAQAQTPALSAPGGTEIHFSASIFQMYGPRQPITSLPDFGKKISLPQQQAIEDSSVKLGFEASDGSMTLICDATKISLRGMEGFLTAKHCLTDKQTASAKPSQLEFFDPSVYPYPATPLAVGLKIIKDPNKSDFAFIEPDPKSELTTLPQIPGYDPGRAYDEVPAMKYRGSIKPIPAGAEAVFDTSGSSTLNRPLLSKGIYLGRAVDEAGRFFDITGVKTVPNYPGGSPGSSGAAGIEANGYTLGPLTTVADYKSNKLVFKIIAAQLGLKFNLSKINELLVTNVPGPKTISSLIKLAIR
ncbi:MAG TPA: hypothetical protein VFP32_01105 [Candidatus Saccharimonadales bacterium]|nr:hypothetical protein [Candidatus Saccharimonadales bacterium]